MTWSIIAKDPDTGFFGIAIASRFFAVGMLCPWAEGRVGAVCTQALMNPGFGPRGLGLLREGLRAADVRDMLAASDRVSDQRQLHVMDAEGTTAAHTGDNCVDWCGHRSEAGLSVAGNMLTGPQVVARTFETFREATELPVVERLLAAMEAGEAAGGDKRGKQSAALLIQGPEPYPRLDLRADDHEDPLAELRRLYAVARERFIPFSAAFPRPERPYGLTDRAVIEKIIERDAGKPLQPGVETPEG